MEFKWWVNLVIITKATAIKAAKINALYTYINCMNNLYEFGYIVIHPQQTLSATALYI